MSLKSTIFSLAIIGMAQTTIAQPSLNWAKNIGGTSNDFGYAITTDAAGNVYTTGSFEGTVDFDPGSGVSNLTSAGKTDIFISKLDASGNFLWVKQIGSTKDDNGAAIVIDAAGNVFTTGYFTGTVDFDPGTAVYNLSATGTAVGTYDIYVSKLDASGNFVWAKNIGGYDYDFGSSIALDASGNVYTGGYFWKTADFDPGPATFNLVSAGDYDAFISKLDPSGNFVWAKQLGGPGDEHGFSLTVDASANVYSTGYFNVTADFNPGPATYNLTASGSLTDIYISKLDSSGNFVWAKRMGEDYWDGAYCIAVDSSGNVYTSGYFYDTVDFDPGPGAFILTSKGATDAFISKLDNAGNFILAKQFGGRSDEYTQALSLDKTGNIYVAGSFRDSVDFDPGPDSLKLISKGNADIFVAKLDAAGNLSWVSQMGGIKGDFPWGIAVDASQNVYTTGFFRDTADFDPGIDSFKLNSAGGDDIFIHKLSQCYINTNTTLSGSTISATMSGASYQWVNCATGYSAISGATSQNYTPTISGSYAVIITRGTGCVDTSDCVSVTGTDINELQFADAIKLYPNPAQNTVTLINLPKEGNLKVMNLIGSVLMETKINAATMNIDLNNYNNGLYFLHISDKHDATAIKKLMINK